MKTTELYEALRTDFVGVWGQCPTTGMWLHHGLYGVTITVHPLNIEDDNVCVVYFDRDNEFIKTRSMSGKGHVSDWLDLMNDCVRDVNKVKES